MLNRSPLALVFYTDNLPEGTGGAAQGPVVRIRPKYLNDVGIHKHELEHVKQFWQTLGLHGFFYIGIRKYRLWSEASAYAKQTQYPDRNGVNMTLQAAATRLTNAKYKLNITQAEAEEAIQREIVQ